MACASSRMTSRQDTSAKPGLPHQHGVRGDDQVGVGQVRLGSGREVRRGFADPSRPGAGSAASATGQSVPPRRASSRAATPAPREGRVLPAAPAPSRPSPGGGAPGSRGTTSRPWPDNDASARCGPSRPSPGNAASRRFAPSPLSPSSSASTWMVLPKPMSSARQAPRPSFVRKRSQLSSLVLIRPERALQGIGDLRRVQGPRPAQAGEDLAHRITGLDVHPVAFIVRAFLVPQIRRRAGEQTHPLDEGDLAAFGLPLQRVPVLDGLAQPLAVHLDPLALEQHQAVVAVEQGVQLFARQGGIAERDPHVEVQHRADVEPRRRPGPDRHRHLGPGDAGATSSADSPTARSPPDPPRCAAAARPAPPSRPWADRRRRNPPAPSPSRRTRPPAAPARAA